MGKLDKKSSRTGLNGVGKISVYPFALRAVYRTKRERVNRYMDVDVVYLIGYNRERIRKWKEKRKSFRRL